MALGARGFTDSLAPRSIGSQIVACPLASMLARGLHPPDLAIEAPQLLSQVGPLAFKVRELFLRQIPLVGVECASEFILGDETTRLPDDRLQGAAVQFPMPGDGERLRGSRGRYAPQFHVTPSLGMNQKAEPAENSHHLVAGEPSTVRCIR